MKVQEVAANQCIETRLRNRQYLHAAKKALDKTRWKGKTKIPKNVRMAKVQVFEVAHCWRQGCSELSSDDVLDCGGSV